MFEIEVSCPCPWQRTTSAYVLDVLGYQKIMINHSVYNQDFYVKTHYEKKLTKNIRPTDILQIYTSI